MWARPYLPGTEVNDGLQESEERGANSTSPGWQKTWRELDPISSGSCWRQDGVGRGVWCGRLALGRQAEQDEGETAVKAYTLCTNGLISPLAGSVLAGPGASARGRAPEGKGRLSNTSLVLGEGRKCRWRLQIQKRGEFLNNGTKLRLSPRVPAGLGPGGRSAVCRGCEASAAAFLPFTVPRELHHVVLLLLLLFR